MHRFALAAAVSIAVLTAPASATSFQFSISGGATGSGVIEATPFDTNVGTVTSVTGTINGVGITGVRPYHTFVNDNVLHFGDGAKFSSAGLGLFMADGDKIDLFYNFAEGSHRIFDFNTQVVKSITFTLGAAAVPEPAAWMTMVAGFLITGLAMRRRRITIRHAAA